MLPASDIQQYGGKAAILNHMRDRMPDLPIPRYVVLEAGESLDHVLPEFEAMRTPVIVRSSSPHEYAGFEGIFESVRDVDRRSSLETAVRKVQESANSERAQEYARQNGVALDGKMHVIVQEQSPSGYNGAMMRHPNNPDLLFVSYFLGWGESQRDHYFFLLDERTKKKKDSHTLLSDKECLGNALFLAKAYKRIETETDLGEGEVLYVEFGLQPFAVYQARPFKKIETADFDMPETRKGLWSDLVFGITPPDGIVLPVLRSLGYNEGINLTENWRALLEDATPFCGKYIKWGEKEMSLRIGLANLGAGKSMGALGGNLKREFGLRMAEHHKHMEGMIKKPYCLTTTSAHRDAYDVDLSVPNMQALVTGGMDAFLVHGMMRLLKKARVTIAQHTIMNNEFYTSIRSVDDKVRIISNGKEGVVLRE